MSAKDFRCTVCGDYGIKGRGKLCTRCYNEMVNSHEWKQAHRERRDRDRRIKKLKDETKQIERAAVVAWIKRKREEHE